jgi:competence protein ComEC
MRLGTLFFIFFVLLSVLIFRFLIFNKNLPVYKDGQKIQFSGRLSEEPKIGAGTQRFKLKAGDGLQAYIVTRASQEFQYGDELFIDGVFTKKEYMGHFYWTIYFPKIQTINKEENVLTKYALFIRNKAQSIYNSVLSPTSAGLLLGIVFGGKQGMPDAFMGNLRAVGVLHVIAASGMNVSFVAGALMYMLGSVMKRQFALIFGIVGVIFYTFITGFEASIIRAAIMAVLAFSASLLGRQNLGVVALFLTGYLMLLWQPNFLSDVGFQLSFLATLGILLIKPLFSFKKNLFAEDIGTTIAAEIMTVPVLLGVFGNVGLLSLVVNSLILWTVPFLMTFGSLAVLLGLLFEPLGKLILLLTIPLLLFFEWIVTFFGNLGWVVHLESLPWGFIVGYYLVVFSIVLSVQKKKRS